MTAVTVVIPTRNRSMLLHESLASALAQDHRDVRVEVHDNASTDDTAAVVQSFADQRVRYVPRSENVGLYGNWNAALAQVRTRYVMVLQDDDVLLPGFVRRSVQALEAHPGAALWWTDVMLVDEHGRRKHRQRCDVPDGRIEGSRFLHRIVDGENLVLHVSSVVMRIAALRSHGLFDVLHQDPRDGV